jgi:soluble lytic murein transglycosylase-like protein
MHLRRKLACCSALAALLSPAAWAEVPAPEAPHGWSHLAVLHNGFTIRHARREHAHGLLRLYLSHDGRSYVELPAADVARFERQPLPAPPPAAEPAVPAAPAGVHTLIEQAARRHRLDPDLIASVVAAESAFDPRAVSPKGARGLMQLMPSTAAELGLRLEDIFEPAANLEAGTRYLRGLLDLYRGDLARALAAYNAGPERVARHRGIPPFPETRAYVARVIRDFNRRKLAQRAPARPPLEPALLAASAAAGQ